MALHRARSVAWEWPDHRSPYAALPALGWEGGDVRWAPGQDTEARARQARHSELRAIAGTAAALGCGGTWPRACWHASPHGGGRQQSCFVPVLGGRREPFLTPSPPPRASLVGLLRGCLGDSCGRCRLCLSPAPPTTRGNWEQAGVGFVPGAAECRRCRSVCWDARSAPGSPSFVPLSLPFSTPVPGCGGVCGTVVGAVGADEAFTPWVLPQEAVPSRQPCQY